MRGIGTGQRIHVMIIPEVAELMQREEDAAARNAAAVAAELSDSLKDGGDRQTLSENISALAGAMRLVHVFNDGGILLAVPDNSDPTEG